MSPGYRIKLIGQRIGLVCIRIRPINLRIRPMTRNLIFRIPPVNQRTNPLATRMTLVHLRLIPDRLGLSLGQLRTKQVQKKQFSRLG